MFMIDTNKDDRRQRQARAVVKLWGEGIRCRCRFLLPMLLFILSSLFHPPLSTLSVPFFASKSRQRYRRAAIRYVMLW